MRSSNLEVTTMDGETIPFLFPATKLVAELWTEILARLPVIDLLRFRCVSKTWCSIIDDPNFVHMHLSMFKDNWDKRFLFWENYITGIGESRLRIRGRLSHDEFTSHTEIISTNYSLPVLAFDHLGYVNGLMLFCMFAVDPSYKLYLHLYLFNPSIRKFLKLPPLPSHPGPRAVVIFGYDPLGNDYKVVAVQFPFPVAQATSPGFILVYELSTQCWRVNTSSCIQVQDKGSMGKGVYAKGVMHWIYYVYDTSSIPKPKPRNYTNIVCFDFAAEEFSYARLPGDRVDGAEILTFPFVLGDSFAILDITCVSTCIWVLREYHSTWSKWYEGDSDSDTFGFFQHHKDGINHVLYVEKIRKFLLAVKAQMIFYDVETRVRVKGGFISQCLCAMEPYVESLLLSKGIGSPFLNTMHSQGSKRGGW